MVFHGLEESYLQLSQMGRDEIYYLHHLLEFDPVRKCMSVIIEDKDGRCTDLVLGHQGQV